MKLASTSQLLEDVMLWREGSSYMVKVILLAKFQ